MTSAGESSFSAYSLPPYSQALVLAVPRILPLTRPIVGERVAVGAEQARPRPRAPAFHLSVLRPALPEVALAVVEVEAGDHPVAVEGDVIAQQRRELRVGLHAVERAVELPRDRTPCAAGLAMSASTREGVLKPVKLGVPGKVGHGSVPPYANL